MAKSTNFFVGANSGEGFRNLFPEMVDIEDTYDLMILKGGPGVGKNTFMREVAQAMEAAGTPVERLWCSGDPDSLDGVVLPELRCAVVDGTSPHASVTEGRIARTIGKRWRFARREGEVRTGYARKCAKVSREAARGSSGGFRSTTARGVPLSAEMNPGGVPHALSIRVFECFLKFSKTRSACRKRIFDKLSPPLVRWLADAQILGIGQPLSIVVFPPLSYTAYSQSSLPSWVSCPPSSAL